MLEATELRWSGCAFRYLITIVLTCSAVTPVVPALAVSGVTDRAVSATRPASRAATDFERIFSGKVLAVLYIVSSWRKLQWLLRQTKNWSRKPFCKLELILILR